MAKSGQNPLSLSSAEIKQIESASGLNLETLDFVTALKDRTLAYKGKRVLLYIRDISDYGSTVTEPRFHISDCKTLEHMRNIKRFERYVISTRTDGNFLINIIGSKYGPTEKEIHLSVCQNCLGTLSFDGFNFGLSKHLRTLHVNQFRISRFFTIYPSDNFSQKPEHDSESAPLNDYEPDFSEASNRLRREANWTCQKCYAVLSDEKFRRFLDVHHVNGLKSDNRRENLKVLCIKCHANEPGHHHMKRTPRYMQAG